MGAQFGMDENGGDSEPPPHLEKDSAQGFVIKNNAKMTTRFCSTRVVLYQGSHLTGNVILFDSAKKDSLLKKPGIHNEKALGEMIFGSTPLALKSCNTKVHFLSYYKQTLFSKLFQLDFPKRYIEYIMNDETIKVDQNGANSELRDQSCYSIKPHFGLGVILMARKPSANFDTKSFEQKAKWIQNLIFSNFLLIELQMKSLMKSMSQALRKKLVKLFKKMKKQNSLESIFQGVTINLKMSEFLLQNDLLLQQQVMHFRKFLDGFIHSPRLPHPLWYKRMLSTSKHESRGGREVFHIFKRNFLNLMDFSRSEKRLPGGATKGSNGSGSGGTSGDSQNFKNVYFRFLFSVFTAILTHHTSWVIPFVKRKEMSKSSPLRAGAGGVENTGKKKASRDLLVDQMCSIFGSANGEGRLKKFCRVLVIGSDTTLVKELLFVISYFLRCDMIIEKEFTIKHEPRRKVGSTTGGLNPSLGMAGIGMGIGDNMNECGDTDSIKFFEIVPTMQNLDSVHVDSPSVSPSTSTPSSPSASAKGDNVKVKKANSNSNSKEEKLRVPKFQKITSRSLYLSNITFGYSLYGDICSKYCGAFVLAGLHKNVDYFEDTITTLKLSIEEPFLNDTRGVDESVCVVVDVNELMCNVISAQKRDNRSSSSSSPKKRINVNFTEATSSPFVVELFKKLYDLSKIGVNDDQLDSFINDKMHEFFVVAELMADTIEKERLEKDKTRWSKEYVAKKMKIHVNDIPLLKNIVSNFKEKEFFYLIE